MNKQKVKQYSSLREFYTQEKAKLIESCNACGECFSSCPVYPLTSSSSKNPNEIQQKVLDALEGKPSDEARERAHSCIRCATCIDSCPVGLNPYLLQVILRAEMGSCGFSPPWAKPQIGSKVYDLQEVLGFLQIKPSEIRWLKKVPPKPERKDLVLFMGCGTRVMPDQSMSLVDILEKMGLNFVALGGGELCCGGVPVVNGNLDKADRVSADLIASLAEYQPKRVAFSCGTCYYQANKVFPTFADINYGSVHVSQLLADEIHRLKFVKPINAKVAIHDSCNRSRRGGEVESLRRLLGSVPGVKIVEMAHNRKNALCCGVVARDSYPLIFREMRNRVLDEAKESGAEILATTCTGCHRTFCGEEKNYPFKVKSYITLLAEAAGIQHEDKLKKYLQLGSVEEIIEHAREYIEASPYTIEEFRQLLPLYFKFESKARKGSG